MAFRAVKNWQLTIAQVGGARRSFTSPTNPKLKSMSQTIGTTQNANSTSRPSTLKAELTPVYMVWGMVAMALAIGTHTAFQQLARSPTVHINKKRRESMPEVSDPDRTFNSATKFIDGSFLRKVGQIQEKTPTVYDPVHPDPYTRPRIAETLKTVGVEPSRRR